MEAFDINNYYINIINIFLGVTSIVVSVFAIFFSMVFYRWSNKSNENANTSLEKIKSEIGTLNTYVEKARQESEEARKELTYRIFEILSETNFRQAPMALAESVSKGQAPMQEIISDQSQVVSLPSFNMVQSVKSLNDNELILLIGLQSLQSKYKPVEQEVLKRWAQLDNNSYDKAFSTIKKKGFILEDGSGLIIPDEYFHELSNLFYVDVPFPARPSTLLNSVRERINRIKEG